MRLADAEPIDAEALTEDVPLREARGEKVNETEDVTLGERRDVDEPRGVGPPKSLGGRVA